MNISDWQHAENSKELKRLAGMGFVLNVTADGYFVSFGEQGIDGASVLLPRGKPLHWRHREPNIRDNLASAIRRIHASWQYRDIMAMAA